MVVIDRWIVLTRYIYRLIDLYFVGLGSVSGWSAQWASRSLMGWKFDRLGDDFPLVSTNWLRSKLVIDCNTSLDEVNTLELQRVANLIGRRSSFQMLERFIYLPQRADLFPTPGFVPVKWHRVTRGRMIYIYIYARSFPIETLPGYQLLISSTFLIFLRIF